MRIKETRDVAKMIVNMQGKQGTNVIANPELDGTEEVLKGLQVGDSKYKTSLGDNYSETEHVVGTWISGKPLYEKTIVGTLGNYTGTGGAKISYISLPSTIEFVFIKEQFVVGTTGTVQTIPYQIVSSTPNVNANCKEVIRVSVINLSSRKELMIMVYSTQVDGNAYYITVRYTKTTD